MSVPHVELRHGLLVVSFLISGSFLSHAQETVTVKEMGSIIQPSTSEMCVMDLSKVRDFVLHYCEGIRDKGGPYGCYRMGRGRRPDLYASCDVALIRAIMGEDFRETLTQQQRKEWIDHINSYQVRSDGRYEDTLGHSSLHANGMVIGALGVLRGRQRYPVNLYEAFNTKGVVVSWLENEIDWSRQWGASHLFWGGMHCFSMSSACEPDWLDTVFQWLDAHLDERTGWWRKGVPHANRHEPLGGSVHILPVYQHHGRTFPYPERVIDSVLALQLPNGRWLETTNSNQMTYLELDALYALRYMRSLAPDYRADDVAAAVSKYSCVVRPFWNDKKQMLDAGHPHHLLAAVGAFGLLQQLDPKAFRDSVSWSDIFSDARFYRTADVEFREEEGRD